MIPYFILFLDEIVIPYSGAFVLAKRKAKSNFCHFPNRIPNIKQEKETNYMQIYISVLSTVLFYFKAFCVSK